MSGIQSHLFGCSGTKCGWCHNDQHLLNFAVRIRRGIDTRRQCNVFPASNASIMVLHVAN